MGANGTGSWTFWKAYQWCESNFITNSGTGPSTKDLWAKIPWEIQWMRKLNQQHANTHIIIGINIESKQINWQPLQIACTVFTSAQMGMLFLCDLWPNCLVYTYIKLTMNINDWKLSMVKLQYKNQFKWNETVSHLTKYKES